jgi:hypothetical protein
LRRRDDGYSQETYGDDVAASGLGKIKSSLRKAFPLSPDEVTIDERFKALLEAWKRADVSRNED